MAAPSLPGARRQSQAEGTRGPAKGSCLPRVRARVLPHGHDWPSLPHLITGKLETLARRGLWLVGAVGGVPWAGAEVGGSTSLPPALTSRD